MITLRQDKHKANKVHFCDYCYGTIEKAETYEVQTNVYEGQIYTWKFHSSCQKLASKLSMFDDCDEGVTEDHFQEVVNDKYYELGGYEKLPFKDKLIYIKSKIL